MTSLLVQRASLFRGELFNKEEREKEIVNGKKKVRGCGGQSERRRGKKKLGRGSLPAAAA